MSKTTGGNARKIGRHSRNPSSKLQPQRTERNKRLRVERHAKRMAKIAARNVVRAAYRSAHGGLTRAQVAANRARAKEFA